MGCGWAEGLCVVDFDVEEGQVVECGVPRGLFGGAVGAVVACLAFPDSCALGEEGQVCYWFGAGSGAERLFCCAVFCQRRDAARPRGYCQKSVVVASRLRLPAVLAALAEALSRAYWANGLRSDTLEEFLAALQTAPSPAALLHAGSSVTLALGALPALELRFRCGELLADLSVPPGSALGELATVG